TNGNQNVSRKPQRREDGNRPILQGSQNCLAWIKMPMDPVKTASLGKCEAAGSPHQCRDHSGRTDKDCRITPIESGVEKGSRGRRKHPEDEIAACPYPPDDGRSESRQPQDVEDDMLDTS